MDKYQRLIEFFRQEFRSEEDAGFPRIGRVPDSHVMARVEYYRSLSIEDRSQFVDCTAHWAAAYHAFVIDAALSDPKQHPFFERWSATDWFVMQGQPVFSDTRKSVPLLRAVIAQYKIDLQRSTQSHITEDEFRYAETICEAAPKAPELRRRVRQALQSFGYNKTDRLGRCHCFGGHGHFFVDADYGGKSAQLRYCVSRPGFEEVLPPAKGFVFEMALGFGFGDWDFITAENVDETFELFEECVAYCINLPKRIRTFVSG